MEPDEVIPASDDVQRIIDNLTNTVTKTVPGAIQAIQMAPEQALALLAIGAVGGAIGGKILKGGIGIVIGGAGLVWAYNALTKNRGA